ncbi:MAG: hypothetical protein LBS00_04520 [Synergistaceae bacterium]|nr:hypothetical protein [Synergistaceae bacterium]
MFQRKKRSRGWRSHPRHRRYHAHFQGPTNPGHRRDIGLLRAAKLETILDRYAGDDAAMENAGSDYAASQIRELRNGGVDGPAVTIRVTFLFGGNYSTTTSCDTWNRKGTQQQTEQHRKAQPP